LPEKLTKFSEFYIIFAPKMAEFYMMTPGKIFFPNFGGTSPMPENFSEARISY